MSRFIADYSTGKPDDFLQLVIEDYMKKEGFRIRPYKDEMVWKKGKGILSVPQYIKISWGQGIVHVEAFLKFALLPGVYAGEMGLNGLFGYSAKKALQNHVDTLMRLLYQPLPNMMPNMMPYAQPATGNVTWQDPAQNLQYGASGQAAQPFTGNATWQTPVQNNLPFGTSEPVAQPVVGNASWQTPVQNNLPYGAAAPAAQPTMGDPSWQTPVQNMPYSSLEPVAQPAVGNPSWQTPVQNNLPYGAAAPAVQPMWSPTTIPVMVHNPTDKATLSLVFGLVSIIGLLFAFIGVVTACMSISFGIIGRKSTAKGKATAGIVISIIFLVLSVINWIASIFLYSVR